MLLLQSLPTVIGVAAIAPALLLLWLVIAADERPGPVAQVWIAFVLGAASISLLGIARAPFAAILAVPGNPWMTQGLRSVFGVAAPEEIVKVLVIIGVSWKRRTFADPMDTVVYGAAAGLGFAAYENLAYLVQHADMWRSLAALRSVLTVPFHGALGIIAGAYIAIARAGTALGANRHNRASRAGCWPCSRRSRCMQRSIFRCSRCRSILISVPPRECCWERQAWSSASPRSDLPHGWFGASDGIMRRAPTSRGSG
jgi:hypothetical protein